MTSVSSNWVYPKSLFIAIITLVMASPIHADPLKALQRRLPMEVRGWKTASEDRLFNDKTIFEYINGAGEVYRAYNMKTCLARRYHIDNGPAIILDIFDQGSSKDAFGVFTHDTEGDPISIGQGGRYRPGWLSFWKHRFFISIYMESESPEAEAAVMELGRIVDTLIQQTGSTPDILKRLPLDGLEEKTIRYLHHPIVLNYHFYLADDNILNISSDTDAALATYHLDNQEVLLLLVEYPDTQMALTAIEKFFTLYLPDADHTGAARLEDGKWSVAQQNDRVLAVVLEADTKEAAHQLLALIGKQR